MPAENKMTMTRVIVGVASVGATLALVYLYNKYQDRKGKSGTSSSSTGSRLRRQSSKSGEVKKVTFKTDDDNDDDKVKGGCKSASSTPGSSKLLSKEFDKERLAEVVPPPLEAKHEAGEKNKNLYQTQSRVSGEEEESGVNTTNTYENNSTLKLEDSMMTTATTTSPPVVSRSRSNSVEEVISGSKQHQPLMTSTPLPGKDPVGKRPAVAAIEPHSSDLQSPAQVAIPASETDYDSYSYRKEMRIPREIVASLIGKKGCNIKGIQAQSNTNINFHDETLENGDRMCVIRGAPASVTVAESLIEKFIIEQPTVYTETLTVPLSSVGRIIGRGGDTIRQIQDLSKARVNVESQNHYGNTDTGHTRSIIIKGSEEQILVAKQLIIEKVEEERNLRKNIDVTTAGRTHRRAGGGVSPSTVPGFNGAASSTIPANAGSILPVKQDGTLEVFVSCVYHPNDFYIQFVGRDSIELDKLCEMMTDHYSTRQNGQKQSELQVGDIVAAPFEVDSKMYRAKIIRIDKNRAEVSYLDYGDRRVLPMSEIHELNPKFLHLRFQAIQATLNLGCIGEKWSDEVINEFCDLTFCAQWQSLTARVKDYLKDVEDGHDVIWIELLYNDVNIGEELVRKRLATPKGPSGCNNGAQNRKSYAAVALGVSNNLPPTEPVISSADPTLQESLNIERNGN